jgi:hypothetical protein
VSEVRVFAFPKGMDLPIVRMALTNLAMHASGKDSLGEYLDNIM